MTDEQNIPPETLDPERMARVAIERVAELETENTALQKQLAECRRDWAGTLSTLANSFGRSGWPSDKGVAEKLLRKAAELRRMAEEANDG